MERARENGFSYPNRNSKHQLEQCSGRCSHIVVKVKFETDASLRPQWETNPPFVSSMENEAVEFHLTDYKLNGTFVKLKF